VKNIEATRHAQRLRIMHEMLVQKYGPQYWWPASTPFEVVLGTYLTQNTSWKAVEVSLENLRRAGALSVDGIRNVALEHLKSLIRPSGFYTRKAPALKEFVALLDAEFGGALEELAAAPTKLVRTKLLSLPSVGPETADAILLYALGHVVPVADEYLRRIAVRHKLIAPAPEMNDKVYESLVQLTRAAFANDSALHQPGLFNEFHALTVAVGKAHCGLTPDCSDCPLAIDFAKLSISRKHS